MLLSNSNMHFHFCRNFHWNDFDTIGFAVLKILIKIKNNIESGLNLTNMSGSTNLFVIAVF